jgi:aurora kinase
MLELAKGGDAFDFIHEKIDAKDSSRLSESEACCSVIRPLVTAIAYLHAKSIMHRDIKAENLLMADNNQSAKLADFGFAISYRQRRPTTRLGTLEYMVGRCASVDQIFFLQVPPKPVVRQPNQP